MLPRIFDAFEQADRRITRRFGGLGLGSAVSRAIVEPARRQTSRPPARGAGAAPPSRSGCRPASAGGSGRHRGGIPAPTATAEPLASTAGCASSSWRTMPTPPRPWRDLLRCLGHEVTVAGTVAGALDAVAKSRRGGFDLVISDLGLPDGSGLDLMRELARRYGAARHRPQRLRHGRGHPAQPRRRFRGPPDQARRGPDAAGSDSPGDRVRRKGRMTWSSGAGRGSGA